MYQKCFAIVWIHLDKLFYVALTILGLYFIGEGQVMPKFLSEKTNFAEYDEPIQELPTFTSHVLGHKINMSYGEDFNISFELGSHMDGSVLTNLTFGNNLIANTSLILDLETIESGNVYKITPINFSQIETSMMFKFRYSFKDTTNVSHISLRLSTELGAIKLDDNTYNSDHVEYRGQLAETTLIILSAQKYKFLQSKGCHKESVIQ